MRNLILNLFCIYPALYRPGSRFRSLIRPEYAHRFRPQAELLRLSNRLLPWLFPEDSVPCGRNGIRARRRIRCLAGSRRFSAGADAAKCRIRLNIPGDILHPYPAFIPVTVSDSVFSSVSAQASYSVSVPACVPAFVSVSDSVFVPASVSASAPASVPAPASAPAPALSSSASTSTVSPSTSRAIV